MKKLFIILGLIILLLSNASSAHAYYIKIGLQTRVSKAIIGCQTESYIIDNASNQGVVKLHPRQKYTLFSKNNKIFIKKSDNSNTFNTEKSSIILLPDSNNSLVYAKNGWYRGYLKIISRGNLINIVNVVDLEDYLKGVVPSEMPSHWSIEALKAQAITARSYAIANIKKHAKEGYNLNDTPQDQAYGGVKSEKYRSNYAVESTKGQVMVSNNKIIPAYYHSSSGGVTDNEAWSEKINFIRPVRDFDFDSPKAVWKKEYNLSNTSQRLAKAGCHIGNIKEIETTHRTSLGRVKQLKLTGTNGSKFINGEKFESIFKLPSNFFNVYITDNSLVVLGRGSGHGVGMSQWGAKTLADRGYTAYQILGYYFTNVEVRIVEEQKA